MAPRSMTPGQARVIDPILSNHARGYTNTQFIGHLILPYVDIATRGARVIKFGKDSFRKYNTRRAPGAKYERVSFGYASDPVALHQDALEAGVPIETKEEAAKIPGIDIAAMEIEVVQDIIALGREVEIANKVLDPNAYGAANKMALGGADKWTDPASDPDAHIQAGSEQIRKRIGRKPNTLTLGPDVFNALSRHEKIKSQFKYTSSESVTADMLAKYFNIEKVLVGEGVVLPDAASDDDDAVDIWGANALLSFTPRGRSYRVPGFGYIYRLKGSPSVQKPYFEEQSDSWVYKVKEEWSAEMTGADAGFLFTAPV